MRRPRHKLEVSTFPFLAVLLGAMGSLILLLLVMDRRAKIVARNKYHEVQESRLAAAARANRENEEAWERQRQELRDLLAAQEQQARGQLQVLLGEVGQSRKQLQAQAASERQLQALLEAEQTKLNRERDELRARQMSLLQTVQVEEASKSELNRLTRELLDLEQTLDGLKRLKSQQPTAYSLVPYRGQRGENRLPIYIECTRAGLIFLPDRLTLSGGDFDILRFRTEVERRHGPLVKEQKVDPFRASPTADQPYVLFLIRPDGIGNYYRGQNALRGFQIDYGYELVDADWALEISTAAGPVASAPPDPPSNRVPVSRSPNLFQGPGVAFGAPAGQAPIALPGATLSGPGGNGFGSNSPGGNDAGPGTGRAFAPGGAGSSDGSSSVGPGSVPGGKGMGPSGLEPGLGSNGGSGTPNRPNGLGGAGLAGIAQGPPGTAKSPGYPSNGVTSPEGGVGNPFNRVGASSDVGHAASSGQPSGTPGSTAGDSTAPSFRPAQAKGPTQSILDGPTPSVKIPGAVAGSANSDVANAQPQPELNDGSAAPSPGSTDPSAKPPASGGQPQLKFQQEPSELGNAIGRLAPPLPPPPEKRPKASPLALGRVVGNRDFIVTLACYGEGVVVTPGSATFALRQQANLKQIDEALVRAVTQIVSRRQATVRDGEPPYRAVLRFEVHPQGLRTYHHVYPLLEGMRLPMVRENVED